MGIFLIVLGGFLLLVCGVLLFASHKATKDKESWDSFYKMHKERSGSVLPEEMSYKIVMKMKMCFIIGTLLGALMLMGGILVQTLVIQ